MKILIVSDTHGQDRNLMRALLKEKPIDRIIHLGDIGKLEEYIEEATKVPCFMVKGNTDVNSYLPGENIVMIGKHRAFITHGHYYGVAYGHKEILRHAKALECDTVIYGHTHVPELTIEEGITILNPGSLTLPRQPGKKPSYILAETDETGEALYEVRYFED